VKRSLAAALLIVVGLIACEKDPPPSAGPGPTVIVEQPGPPAKVGTEDGAPPSDANDPEFGTIEVVTTDVPCSADADCVKDDCCHATSCVAIADAPDCSATMCTLECRAKTMDCNGGCVCQAGFCAAQLWSAPDV
jgi:hypothetical protein